MIDTIPAPIMLIDMPDHHTNKQLLLDAINQMPNLSIKTDNDQITKSDWEYDHNTKRDYWDILLPSINTLIQEEVSKLNLTNGIKVSNCWYQQYYMNDTHSWHRHQGTTYNCVYYLELPSDAPTTMLRNPLDIDQTFTPQAIEGQVLIFPSLFSHTSLPNQSKQRKTIIAFNIV